MDTKKLRKKILDLAIHGKLVPQDPNDEPASVLLERIRAEKERLVKEGKIKKSKSSKTTDTPHYENRQVGEANVPFEVPSSWSIIPLENLATFSGGKTPSMDNKEYWNNGKHLWVTSKDMKSVHITDSLMKISDSALEQMNIYPKGTLLLVTRSGILRHTLPIAILGNEATVNQDIKTISCHLPNNNRYLYFAIKAQEQVILEQYHKDGTTVDSIDFDKFKKLPIPLPPIEEQSRIIAEINRLFALIDTIENNQTDLEATIAQTKSKILDLAIHGKLVPQDPSDEPASELLKRINPKAEITCDNGQYGKIPKNWCWCKLEELCKIKGGKRIPRGMSFSDKKTPYIYLRVTDMKSNTILLDDLKYVDKEVFEQIKNYTINSTDLYLTIAGTIGSVGIIPEVVDGMNLTENAAKLTNIVCNKEYLLYALQSYIAQDHFTSRFHQVAQPKLSIETANKTPVPLPPLAEQQRIVDAIEKAFGKLEAIMKSL